MTRYDMKLYHDMKNDNLFECLSKFQYSDDENKLQEEFVKLAPAFLFGGYINVRDEFRIYIRTVEFYCHSERPEGVHDPIVYHRNGKYLDEVPYFPLMTLHAHNSGFDITFESLSEKCRASALIRAYEVVDKNRRFLKWVSANQRFERCEDYCYNTQSTYLYPLLNGFVLDEENDVRWVDSPFGFKSSFSVNTRKGVYVSESEFEYKPVEPKVKCNRMWSFTRNSKI